jgi:hypothetical protein
MGIARLALELVDEKGKIESYRLVPLSSSELRSWQLRKKDGTIYRVAETHDGLTCNCLGNKSVRHYTACKHIRGLKAMKLITDFNDDVP